MHLSWLWVISAVKVLILKSSGDIGLGQPNSFVWACKKCSAHWSPIPRTFLFSLHSLCTGLIERLHLCRGITQQLQIHFIFQDFWVTKMMGQERLRCSWIAPDPNQWGLYLPSKSGHAEPAPLPHSRGCVRKWELGERGKLAGSHVVLWKVLMIFSFHIERVLVEPGELLT